MRATTSQPVFFDDCTATFTWLIRPVIRGVLELKIAWVAIGLLIRIVRKRAATRLNCSSHHGSNRAVQTFGLRPGKLARLGMDFGEPQAFISINVADTGNRFLREQRRFNPRDFRHRQGERLKFEIIFQRFRSHAGERGDVRPSVARHDLPEAEPSRIDVTNLAHIRFEPKAFETWSLEKMRAGFWEAKTASHFQMHDHVQPSVTIGFESEDQILTAPLEGNHAPSNRIERVSVLARIAVMHTQNRAVQQIRLERSARGFNFGQFGHDVIITDSPFKT